MVAKHLFAYKHSCVASPGYLKRFGIPKFPIDLINHQCLKGHDQPAWTFISAKIPVHGWLEINDNHMLKHLALKGHGIIRVPEYLVDKEILSGQLQTLFADDMPQGYSIYLLHPQRIHQSSRLDAFIDFTRSYFKKSR